MSLSLEQMQFLADKGLSIQEVIEFVSMTPVRSKNAERQARYRARQRGDDNSESVTDNVTRDATDDNASSLSPSPNENNSNPHPHTHPEHTPRARKAEDFPRPVWAEVQVWTDLLKNRKTKRLPNTPTAYAEFVAKVEAFAEDGWPPGEVLRAIVARGWGGAHDPREDRKPGHDHRHDKPSGTRTAAQRALQLVESRGH